MSTCDLTPTEQSSHTPGPWMAAASASSIVGWPVVGPRGRAVASVHCVRGDTPEGKLINAEAGANARLIAAAPNMAAALKRALSWLSSYPGGNAEGAYMDAVNALKKAGCYE